MLEASYRSFGAGRFVNPGLLKGPYLILYGSAALAVMSAIDAMSGCSLLAKAVFYLLITTFFELGSGLLSRLFSRVRLWDYSGERFNYKGYICLKFSIYWVFLSFAFEYLILPAYQKLLAVLPVWFMMLTVIIMFFIILADMLIVISGNIKAKSREKKTNLFNQFVDLSESVLNLPEVMSLSEYPHHRAKTRLDHVMEVAFLSFLLGRKLNLDLEAIVKGALLHDLFYYDWRTEGPRLHGFRHHTIALKNAEKITKLSRKEQDIIKKHMWPLTVVPPVYAESWIVCLADTYCSVLDYLPFISRVKSISRIKANEKSISLRN
jgi:uncharacterized protein